MVQKKDVVSEETKGDTFLGGGSSTILKNPSMKLVRMYRSTMDDLKWARKGAVSTVINGEAVPLVQQRIEDAGFTDLVITPLGADK
ncbi:sulfate transporter, partial [Trifolium medium]|nr:sulfate transporter [Trifolium medium]